MLLENTLAAFDNAIKDGADYIEIDLRTTRESQLVIMQWIRIKIVLVFFQKTEYEKNNFLSADDENYIRVWSGS